MTMIPEDTMTLERMLPLFRSEPLPAQVVEVLPAAPALDLDRDAWLKVDYADDCSVVMWFDMFARCQLRMRAVVVPHGERPGIGDSEWLDWAADLNTRPSALEPYRQATHCLE